MTGKTHLICGVGLALAAGVAVGLSTEPFVCGGVVGGIAALLPDLDHPHSKASRSGPNRLISYPLNALFGHRGFIHSPLLWGCLTALLYFGGAPIWLWLGFGVGTFSHLLLDTLNPAGIPWLYPYKKKFHIVGIRTGSAGEYLIVSMLGLVLCVGSYVLMRNMLP